MICRARRLFHHILRSTASVLRATISLFSMRAHPRVRASFRVICYVFNCLFELLDDDLAFLAIIFIG